MLPREFRPAVEADLVRVGRDYDGGYLVSPESIANTEILVSFGICTDWSFEEDFRSRKTVPVVAYDHTITPAFWRQQILLSSVRGAFLRRSPLDVFRDVRLYRKYKRFFSTQGVVHRQEMIGLACNGATDLRMVIADREPLRGAFLKVDIEGSEYRILDQLVDAQGRMSGMVIEFHDCDLHRERIRDFIRDFDLPLVHIHPNNYGGVDDAGDPLVLEMTFKRQGASDRIRRNGSFPVMGLDQPNDPEREELPLRFES